MSNPDQPPFPENRKSRRFAVDVGAQVRIGESPRFSVRTRDISRSGICVVSDRMFACGENIHVALTLSFGEEAFSEPLELPARTVWCTQIDGLFQVGAKFMHLDTDQASYLLVLLNFLNGTVSPDRLKMAGAKGGGDQP